MFEKYIARLCAEIDQAPETARQQGHPLDRGADTIYFGGGTPTLLDVTQLDSVFVKIRQNFVMPEGAEITMECAPGTLSDEMLDCFARNGVNRVSLGVQSFVDQEARSVGRLHSREVVLNDIARLRSAGISNINVDLIAGLPHQTIESWEESLDQLIAAEVPHASVYMLEVDEDSRLGRELIAGGQKYHAHFVPDEDLTADMYEIACERLNATGIEQYEISNFARARFESKHNLKYWTRQPYLGFGVDAHSMLVANSGSTDQLGREAPPVIAMHHGQEEIHDREGDDLQSCRKSSDSTNGTAESRALSAFAEATHLVPVNSCATTISADRFSNPDSLEQYIASGTEKHTFIDNESAVQESFFLGLRMNRGISLDKLADQFGEIAIASYAENISELVETGLLTRENDVIRLTPRGRLLSNDVFERFVSIAGPAECSLRL